MKIGGGTSHIVYISLESVKPCKELCLVYDRLLAASPYFSALMECYGTKSTASETPSVSCYAELHFLDSWHTAIFFIRRMICPLKRKLVEHIQFLCFHWHLGRILNYKSAVTVSFYETFSVDGLVAPVLKRETPAVFILRCNDFIEIRQYDVVVLYIWIFHPHTCTSYPCYIPGLYA